MLTLVHSVPAAPRPVPCASVTARPHPRLRPYVLGYADFASGDGAPVRHRVLPFTLTTLVIDVTGAARLVTGPRDTPAVHTTTAWAAGVTAGLTPLGARALLGVPMAGLAGASLPLADVLGGADGVLAERLAAAPDRRSRFAVLDDVLAHRLARTPPPEPLVLTAWELLHRPGVRVGALAARLGVSRRYLELGFRRQIGLPPGTVARIARFQRAVGLLAAGAGPARTAADCGYADQPHLQRDVRRMAGVTPAGLCALLQYGGPAGP